MQLLPPLAQYISNNDLCNFRVDGAAIYWIFKEVFSDYLALNERKKASVSFTTADTHIFSPIQTEPSLSCFHIKKDNPDLQACQQMWICQWQIVTNHAIKRPPTLTDCLMLSTDAAL